jgi:hypothetical protein
MAMAAATAVVLLLSFAEEDVKAIQAEAVGLPKRLVIDQRPLKPWLAGLDPPPKLSGDGGGGSNSSSNSDNNHHHHKSTTTKPRTEYTHTQQNEINPFSLFGLLFFFSFSFSFFLVIRLYFLSNVLLLSSFALLFR